MKIRLAKEFGSVLYKLMAIGEDKFNNLPSGRKTLYVETIKDLNRKLIASNVSRWELADYLDLDPATTIDMMETVLRSE